MSNNPTVVVLEGVQKLLAQEDTMWRTLNNIDNYCENEIARAEEKEKLEIPERNIKLEVPEKHLKQEVKECVN